MAPPQYVCLSLGVMLSITGRAAVPEPGPSPAPVSDPLRSVISSTERAALARAVEQAMEFRDSYDRLPHHGHEWAEMLAQEEWGTLRHRIYPHIGHGPANRRWVSLTFDDGPDPAVTPKVLDALRAAGVKATFFLVGRKAERYPDLVRRIVAEGHALGNHSYDHLYLTRIPPESARVELDACSKIIQAITGHPPRYYRPPGGHFDRILVGIGQQLHMLLVTWTFSPGDYADPPPISLLEHALRGLRPGALLIWHDDVPETAQIVPEFIREAKARGYRFVPLSEYEKS
ncbi:MAG: polysaccharide deacetylase family protein [Armatimonadetes bacterium]|nr:polysaccharide deacetylase family protein [Armatimonadota bacterium]